MSDTLRRLELRLPIDHPVWNLPSGDRSRIVKEWLNVGSCLARLEDTMSRIETQISHQVSKNNNAQQIPKQDSQITLESSHFDKTSFLKHFG